jgi:DNA-binding NarL/FixJ family response regulator
MRVRTILIIHNRHLGWHELRHALTTLPACSIIGDTADASRALRQAREHQPTMIIAAPILDGEPTAPLLTAIHLEVAPSSTIVLFATDCSSDHFPIGIEQWLSGYLLWHRLTHDTLRHCLAALLDGDIVLGSRAAAHAFVAALRGQTSGERNMPDVGAREQQVLRALADGHTVQEIARYLNLSERTALGTWKSGWRQLIASCWQ